MKTVILTIVLLIILVAPTVFAMTAKPAGTYVLVHGGNMSTETWNKLAKSNVYTPDGKMGGRVWDSIIPALKAHNYRVFAPTLKDEHSTNLTGHIEQICTLITENDLRDVILVGHSYGGMGITGVGAQKPDRRNALVYVGGPVPD